MRCILWLAASVYGLYRGETSSFVFAYVAMKLLLVGLYVRAWHAQSGRSLLVGHAEILPRSRFPLSRD